MRVKCNRTSRARRHRRLERLGSRQAIAEAETNRAFAEQAARTAAGLRQAGFTQAQQAAQADIASRMQADLANQRAALQAGTTTAQLGQQAQLANQRTGLQAATTTAQLGQQAQMANQAALNQAAQFGAQAANRAALQNAQLATQAAMQNAAGNSGGFGESASAKPSGSVWRSSGK